MINIKTISGEFFDLQPNTNVRLVRENPFFDMEMSFTSKYSLPFDLPKTPNNLRIVGNVDDVQSNLVKKQIAAVLEIEGSVEMIGQVNVLNVSEDFISVSMTRNSIEFDQDTLINELNLFVEEAAPSIEERQANLSKTYPESNFKYLRTANYGENYSLGNSPNLLDMISKTNRHENLTFDDSETMVPYYNLVSIVDAIFAKFNYKVTGSWWRNEEMRKTYIFNTTQINNWNERRIRLYGEETWDNNFSIVLTAKGDIYNEDPKVYTPRWNSFQEKYPRWHFFKTAAGDTVSFYANEVDITNTIVNSTLISYTINAAQAATLSDFMEGLDTIMMANIPNIIFVKKRVKEGVIAEYDYNLSNGNKLVFDDSPVRKDYFTEPPPEVEHYLKTSFNVIDKNDGLPSYTYLKPNSNFHLPKLNVYEFFRSIKINFCAIVDIDDINNKVSISFCKDALTGEIIDLSDMMSFDATKSFESENNMRLTFNGDDKDNKMQYKRLHANNYPEHDLPNTVELRSDGGFLDMEEFDSSFPDVTGLCKYDMPYGNYYEAREDFKLRFLKEEFISTLRGYVATNEGLKPNELYNAFWKDYYNFVKKEMTFTQRKGNIPRYMLHRIIPTSRLKEKNQVYLWKRLETVVHSEQGVLETTIDWVKQ